MIIDFAKFSSIRIGPVCELLTLTKASQIDAFIIGGANNLLLSPSPPKLCKLGKNFDYIKILDKDKDFLYFSAGAATSSKGLFNFAKQNNLKGFEFLAHLPGELGGLLKMNAGLKGSHISEHLISANDKSFSFSYRYSNIDEIIFKACFKLAFGFDDELCKDLAKLRQNQPKGPSFGSIFKNPPNAFAGYLIEKAGLKGFKKGAMMISPKHANFLINTGKGSFSEAIYLIKLAKKTVKESFGVELEEEVIII